MAAGGGGVPPPHVLGSLFAPRTVALVGASERSFLAKTIWSSIRAGGFSGEVFPINPGRTEVFGVPCFPTLAELPVRPDLCLIAVSEQAALGVLEQCVACGIPSAMLFTLYGGTGEGQALRARAKGFLADSPLSVAGSGTFGLINTAASFMPLLASPPTLAGDGKVALVCQSGGILNALARCLSAMGAGLSKAIATGGEDRLGAADYIDFLLTDPGIRAIGCVLEQIKDIGSFRAVCDRARTQGVAVVVLKVGLSEKGQLAAFAHSGSLASDKNILDGLLDQVGAIKVGNLTEMTNVLALLGRDHGPLGGRAGIVTISGGETGLAADLADKHGIELADLGKATDLALRNILVSPDVSYQNPVDVALGSLLVLQQPAVYAETVRTVLEDPGVDFVLARHMEQQGIFEGLSACAQAHSKPIFLYTRTVYDLLTIDPRLLRAPLLILADLELALNTLGKVTQFHRNRTRRAASAGESRSGPVEPRTISLPAPRSGILMEDAVFPLLDQIGFDTPPVRIMQPESDVIAELRDFPSPYVAKILSDTIVHRRSAGGVRIAIQSREEVRSTVDEFFARFGTAVSGVIVEPLIRSDVEFILGAKQTEREGLVIMLGFGGTFVEDFQRPSLRLSPLVEWDADSMLEESGVAAALSRIAGVRGDEVIARLRVLLLAFDVLCRGCGPQLAEFDVNPLGFAADTGRFTALDGKIVLSSKVSN